MKRSGVPHSLPVPSLPRIQNDGRAARSGAPGGLLGLSVRKNAIWSLVGNGGFAACQLGMLVVLARLGTQELVGRYAFGLAITSPIFLFFSLQLRTLLAAHASDDADFNVYLTVRLITTAMATAVVALIGWRHASLDAATVIVAIGLSKAIDSLHDVVYGLYWRCNRMDYIAISMLVRGTGGLAAFALTFQLTRSVNAAVVSLSAIWLLVFAAYDGPVAARLTPVGSTPWWNLPWSSAMAKRLIWLGFPAGILSWLVSLQIYAPRYFVQHELGEGPLGVFSALAAIFIGLELVARSFNHAAVPRLAKFAASRQSAALFRLVRQLTQFGILLSALLIAGSIVLGRPLISLLFGASYAEHSHLFTILSFGFAIRTATMPTAMTLRAVNAYWSLAGVQLLAVAGLSVACMAWVPLYGLQVLFILSACLRLGASTLALRLQVVSPSQTRACE